METYNNHFTVDDLLLDFPTDDDVIFTTNDSSFDSFMSSSSGNEPQVSGTFSVADSQFSGSELCVPYDELAELEWLSRFTEESFSSDDLNNLRLISAGGNVAPVTDTSSSVTGVTKCSNRNNSPIFQNDVLVPGKIRSKRSRAAPEDWSSRLIHLKSTVEIDNDNNYNNINESKTARLGDSVRRCLHCGSDKTPQWRRGPMGPKTLCNACGVRFKSGRLVPEYRPAASPTFVPAKHSNSHRKVMELRRQMELRNEQERFVNRGSSGYEGCNGGDEYLIHRQIGPNFMNMI